MPVSGLDHLSNYASVIRRKEFHRDECVWTDDCPVVEEDVGGLASIHDLKVGQGDVPLAVEILRRRLPPGRVIRPVGQPGAAPPERSRHEAAVSHSRGPSPTEVLGATAPPVGRHPRGHAGRAPAAGWPSVVPGMRTSPSAGRIGLGMRRARSYWAAARSRSDVRSPTSQSQEQNH